MKNDNYTHTHTHTHIHTKRTSLYGAGKRFHEEAMRDTDIPAGFVFYVSALHGLTCFSIITCSNLWTAGGP